MKTAEQMFDQFLHYNDHYASLTISILWVWNVKSKLVNFNCQKGSVLVRVRMETF